MTCKTCNTRNPIGNKFCRECGGRLSGPEGTLAAEEAARAENERRTERAAMLLTDAHLLAEQGKYLSAIAIAEEVAELMPRSSSALSLLTTLYEHTDQQDRAIKVQERMVALNPDSPVDKLRLERLKRGERTTPPPHQAASASGAVPTLRRGAVPLPAGSPPPIFPQWFPMAAFVVSLGLILFFGMLAITPGSAFRHDSTQTSASTGTAPPVISSATPSPMAINPAAQPPPAQDPIRGSDPFVPLDDTRRALQAEAAQHGVTGALPPTSRSGSAIPPVTHAPAAPFIVSSDILKSPADRGRTDGDTSPLPPITATAPSAATNDSSQGFGAGGRVAAAPPSGADAGDDQKPDSNGYMKIQVGPPSRSAPIVAAPPRAAESQPDMEGDPMRRARALQSMGRFSDAIAAYRDAIAAGASAGDADQAIALCYQRLNDSENAIASYQQAIAAYQDQISAGRNAAAAQRGINSSKAALEVLSGQ